MLAFHPTQFLRKQMSLASTRIEIYPDGLAVIAKRSVKVDGAYKYLEIIHGVKGEFLPPSMSYWDNEQKHSYRPVEAIAIWDTTQVVNGWDTLSISAGYLSTAMIDKDMPAVTVTFIKDLHAWQMTRIHKLYSGEITVYGDPGYMHASCPKTINDLFVDRWHELKGK